MASRPAHLEKLTDAEREQVRRAADRIRALPGTGTPADLAGAVATLTGRARIGALVELVATDLSRRWAASEQPLLDEYLVRFPELGSFDVLGHLVVTEYQLRRRHGERPTLASYRVRFPDHATAVEMVAPPDSDQEGLRIVVPGDPGSLAGGYQKLDFLGRGQFGEVWRGRAPGGIDVAIKFIAQAGDREAARRELQALELVKNLRHPHVLPLYAFWVDGGKVHIVMELADGTLRTRLEECRKQGLTGVPRDELIKHASEAAKALDFLHQKNVYHRDVKPDNLVLVNGFTKVADFGLARVATGEGGVSFAGTPIYMAPEVWAGRFGPESDQYSLACSYVELRQGQRPFRGEDIPVLVAGDPGTVARLTGFPPAEEAVVRQALRKEPKDRFASCVAFVRALIAARTEAAAPRSAVASSVPLGSPADVARNVARRMASTGPPPRPTTTSAGASAPATVRTNVPVRPATTSGLPAPATGREEGRSRLPPGTDDWRRSSRSGSSATKSGPGAPPLPSKHRVLLLAIIGVVVFLAAVSLYLNGKKWFAPRAAAPPAIKVTIRTEPVGARVTFLNSSTPSEQLTPGVYDVPPKPVRVRIELAGFRTREEQLNPVERADYLFSLEPVERPLTVQKAPIPVIAPQPRQVSPLVVEVRGPDLGPMPRVMVRNKTRLATAPAEAPPPRWVDHQTAADAIVLEHLWAHGLPVTLHLQREAPQKLDRWRAAAEAGRIDGAVLLGACLMDGIGVTQDERQAIAWWKLAAARGDAGAMAALGEATSLGRGTLRDYVVAAMWFREGAAAGHPAAIVGLGYLHDTGRGVEQDLVRALSYYQEAARQGNSTAMTRLGQCHASGRGVVRQDDVRAVWWFRWAARAGNPSGMYQLAKMYELGRGVPRPDPGEAFRWYRMAAESGDRNAAEALKWYDRDGTPLTRPRD